MTFVTLKTIPNVGRIVRTGNTLVVCWNKPSMRDKFPRMTWDYTSYSDIDLLTHEMVCAAKGAYSRFYTWMFADACKPVPCSNAGGFPC